MFSQSNNMVKVFLIILYSHNFFFLGYQSYQFYKILKNCLAPFYFAPQKVGVITLFISSKVVKVVKGQITDGTSLSL